MKEENKTVQIPMNTVCIGIENYTNTKIRLHDLFTENTDLRVKESELSARVKELEEEVAKLKDDLKYEKGSVAYWYEKAKEAEAAAKPETT